MSKKLLLVEYDSGFIANENELSKQFIIENKINDKEELKINGVPITVFAVLQKYGVLNNNRRIYSEVILKREYNKYLNTSVKEATALFEANHPESTQINILNGAGLLIDAWWEGITLLGKIKLNLSKGFIDSGIVSTSGDHVANLMLTGVKVGVSSRGVGSLKEKSGVNHVQDDYDLICWDFVNQPSSRGSWVSDDYEKLAPFIETTIKEDKKAHINPLKDKLSNFLSNYR